MLSADLGFAGDPEATERQSLTLSLTLQTETLSFPCQVLLPWVSFSTRSLPLPLQTQALRLSRYTHTISKQQI